MVDIGLHYVATVNGLPIDTDGDGLADYVEDTNGNGVVDAGETDWTNPDTDGDGLSDGAEVNATGTDPLNPNDAGSHTLQSVPYSSSAHEWIVVHTPAETVTRSVLVKRGTDALRLFVEVITEENPANFVDYNDRFTYRIKSPCLPAIEGSFMLTELGSSIREVIFPPEWFVCHSKTLEADSYVTVTLTAKDVNGPQGPSLIGVALSALRVDFDPILGPAADDRLVFGTETPQGKLQVNLRATVMPSDAYALDYLTGRVRFEVEAIGDSNLEWGTGDGFATYDGSGKFTNSATFHGLPTSNSAFGPKIAKLFVDGLWELDSQQQIRVFYPGDALNHPGSDPPQGYRPPNYFFYYMQTDAKITQTAYGPFYNGRDEDHHGTSKTEPNPPYLYYVAYGKNSRHRPGYRVLSPGRNGGQYLTYIDLFAWAARHEQSHHKNFNFFWGAAGRDLMNDADLGVGDVLPDNQEWYMGAEGGPFNPNSLNSHPDDDYPGQTADTERHNCNSFNAEEWSVASADAQDWARPGKNWPQ